jgi:hypothetical protein
MLNHLDRPLFYIRPSNFLKSNGRERLNSMPGRSKPSGMPAPNLASEYVLSMGDKLGKYVDEWIGVVDSNIVAKGNSAREVYEAAKKASPGKVPFIMRVPRAQVMVL